MKTSIKLALVAFGAAAMAMPLAAFADDATPEGGNNCSNMRTTTNSRCVHYNEKAHDGWANQQAGKTSMEKWTATHGGDHSAPPHAMTTTVVDSPVPQGGSTAPIPDWGTHVNYADIISGKAARGGTAAGHGGSGGGHSAR